MVMSNFKYNLLQYVSEHPYANEDELKAKFPDHALDFKTALPELISGKFFYYTPTADAINHLISYDAEKRAAVPYFPGCHFVLTDFGHAILEEHLENIRKMNVLENELAGLSALNETNKQLLTFAQQRIIHQEKQLVALKSLAENVQSEACTAVKNYQLALDEADSAKKDAAKSHAISIISIIASVVVPLVIHLASQ